jgi:hypothetical protein
MPPYPSHTNRPIHADAIQKTGKTGKRKFLRRNSVISDQSVKKSDHPYQLNKSSKRVGQGIPEHPLNLLNEPMPVTTQTSRIGLSKAPFSGVSSSAAPGTSDSSFIPPAKRNSQFPEPFPPLDGQSSRPPNDIPEDMQVKSNYIGKFATDVTDLWVGRIPPNWNVETVKTLFETKVGPGIYVEALRRSKLGYFFTIVRCQTTDRARNGLAFHKHQLDGQNFNRYLHVEVSAKHWNVEQRDHGAHGNRNKQERSSTISSRRQSFAKTYPRRQTRGSEGHANLGEYGQRNELPQYRADQIATQSQLKDTAITAVQFPEPVQSSDVPITISQQIVKRETLPAVVINDSKNEMGNLLDISATGTEDMPNSALIPNHAVIENGISRASSPNTVITNPVSANVEDQDRTGTRTPTEKLVNINDSSSEKDRNPSTTIPLSPSEGQARNKMSLSPKVALPVIQKTPDRKVSSRGFQDTIVEPPTDINDGDPGVSEGQIRQQVAFTANRENSSDGTNLNSAATTTAEVSPTEPSNLDTRVISSTQSGYSEKATAAESVKTPVTSTNCVEKGDMITSPRIQSASTLGTITTIISSNQKPNPAEITMSSSKPRSASDGQCKPKRQSEQEQGSINPFAQMKALEKQRLLEAKKAKIQKKKESKKGKKAANTTKVNTSSDIKRTSSPSHSSEQDKEDVPSTPSSPAVTEYGEKAAPHDEEPIKLPESLQTTAPETDSLSNSAQAPTSDTTEHGNSVLAIDNNNKPSSEDNSHPQERHDGSESLTKNSTGSNEGSDQLQPPSNQKPKKNRKRKAKRKTSAEKVDAIPNIKFAQKFSSDKSSDKSSETEEEKPLFPTYHFSEALNQEGVKRLEDPNNPGHTRYGFPLANLIVNQSTLNKEEVLFSRYAVPKMMPKQAAKEQEGNSPQSNSPVRWADTPDRSRSDTGESWTPLSGHRRDRRAFQPPPNTPSGQVPQPKLMDNAFTHLNSRLMAQNSQNVATSSSGSRTLTLRSGA